jgi:predicted RecA/RadA family phage recombinase
MATNFNRPGTNIDWTNNTGGAIAVNALVRNGFYGMGVARTAGPNGAVINVAVDGIFELAADNTTAFLAGDPVYVDPADGLIYKAATPTRLFVGNAVNAKAETGTTALVELRRFTDEPSREITLAATGAETIPVASFLNGKALVVKVPNSAAKTVTFPASGLIPNGVTVAFWKSSAAAFAATPAAAATESIIGTVGTIDAANDRAFFMTIDGGLLLISATIA